MLGMLPGIGKIKKQIDAANLDDSIVKRQRAIISSMTPKERRNPKILDGKRKRRIAAGSGTKVEDINKLLKMHRQMADMMKTMGRNGGMLNTFLGGAGGGPTEPRWSDAGRARKLDPKALEQLPRRTQRTSLPKGLPAGFRAPRPARCRVWRGLPGGLPGLGGGLPKFPGCPERRSEHLTQP